MSNTIDSYENLYKESVKKLGSKGKFHKMCKSNELPQFCDIIFFSKENSTYEEIHYKLSEAKEGISLNMDLNLAYELLLTNSSQLIPLLNKLISKLVSLYPHSLALISKSFSISSLYLTSKFVNLLNYFKENNLYDYENWILEENENFSYEKVLNQAIKFILDNAFSAQTIEEIFHISKIALDFKDKIRFVDWGLEKKRMKINGSNPNEKFKISIKNGLCEKLPLDDVKLIYNDFIFIILKEPKEFIIRFNTSAYGAYYFEIQSKNYLINEKQIIKAYSSDMIISVLVSVFNQESPKNRSNYIYSTKTKHFLNFSLKLFEIAVFLPNFSSNNLMEFYDNSCFMYLLLQDQISEAEFIILKRPDEKDLILNLTDISTALITEGMYFASIVKDCEFVHPKSIFHFGYINIIKKEIQKSEYTNHHQHLEKKEILTHTFQLPMKLPSIITSLFLSIIPFFFLIIFIIKITYLNLKDLNYDRNFLILFKVLSIISMIIILATLFIYWIKLDIFQGLYIFGLTLGITFLINFKLFQRIPFSLNGILEDPQKLNKDEIGSE